MAASRNELGAWFLAFAWLRRLAAAREARRRQMLFMLGVYGLVSPTDVWLALLVEAA